MYKFGEYRPTIDVKQEINDRIEFIGKQVKTGNVSKKAYFDYFGYPDKEAYDKYGT